MLHLDADARRPINDLIIALFRIGGSLVEAGGRLVADIGLTQAWWQVMGALAISPVPLTVPQIARSMGLARQSVQRIVDLLVERGLLALEDNPHHRRAKLVRLTDEGERVYLAAQERATPWARNLEQGLSLEDLNTAIAVIEALDQRLAEQNAATAEHAVIPLREARGR